MVFSFNLPLFCLRASSSNSVSKMASAPGSPVLHDTHTDSHAHTGNETEEIIGYEINNAELATSNDGSKECTGGGGGT